MSHVLSQEEAKKMFASSGMSERNSFEAEAEESKQFVEEKNDFIKQIRCLTKRANKLADLYKKIHPNPMRYLKKFDFEEKIIGQDCDEKLEFLRHFIASCLETCRRIIEEEGKLAMYNIHTIGQALESYCKNDGTEDGMSACHCRDWHMTGRAFNYCALPLSQQDADY
eukprot:m.45086 g.45086  ORF g.45086 m.45086 type:complete len:168 (-) comp12403_c0_seq1:288-791(-)